MVHVLKVDKPGITDRKSNNLVKLVELGISRQICKVANQEF